jgi:hypothetical protein
MGKGQLQELKRPQKENERLTRAVSDLTLGQHRSTQRHVPRGQVNEARLVTAMIELSRQYGRYGYRRIAALLRDALWQVNNKQIERLWRNDGSCIRLRPTYCDHV